VDRLLFEGSRDGGIRIARRQSLEAPGVTTDVAATLGDAAIGRLPLGSATKDLL